jgi:hypothetical protein
LLRLATGSGRQIPSNYSDTGFPNDTFCADTAARGLYHLATHGRG